MSNKSLPSWGAFFMEWQGMKTDNSYHQMTQQTTREAAAYLCPTSPWTEPYQNAPRQASQSSQQADCAAFDSDDQRPTHDALSDIYNRGHE